MLRHSEAGVGPSISTTILSKVAVALFIVFAAICCCVLRRKGTLRAHWNRCECHCKKMATLSSTSVEKVQKVANVSSTAITQRCKRCISYV